MLLPTFPTISQDAAEADWRQTERVIVDVSVCTVERVVGEYDHRLRIGLRTNTGARG